MPLTHWGPFSHPWVPQVFIVICAAMGWGFFFFDEEIKAWWGKQGVDVGKKLLSDQSLQQQAEVRPDGFIH